MSAIKPNPGFAGPTVLICTDTNLNVNKPALVTTLLTGAFGA